MWWLLVVIYGFVIVGVGFILNQIGYTLRAPPTTKFNPEAYIKTMTKKWQENRRFD